MPQTDKLIAPVYRLSPADGQYFFGYYDIPATNHNEWHLCHKTDFRDRFPTPADEAILGCLKVSDAAEIPDEFHPFGKTLAWNFQQGAMLQWLPYGPSTCAYNIFEDGQFGCCIHNLQTGKTTLNPLPVANISQDGRFALCVNMPRIYDFRPGYGYEELPDAYRSFIAPDDDGVQLMNMTTGDYEMLLSLQEIVDFLASEGEEIQGRKVVINHITFNPSATRYLFLLRSFPRPGHPWTTWLLTADTKGDDLKHHNAYGMASHYHWRNDEEILFYMRPAAQAKYELVLLNDLTGERDLVNPEFFLSDGHCSYSPDGKWLLYDSYIDASTEDCFRSLILYSLERDEGMTLGRFRSENLTEQTIDLRCDLHPRWLSDGKSISFDSIHEGFRGVYRMDLSQIIL